MNLDKPFFLCKKWIAKTYRILKITIRGKPTTRTNPISIKLVQFGYGAKTLNNSIYPITQTHSIGLNLTTPQAHFGQIHPYDIIQFVFMIPKSYKIKIRLKIKQESSQEGKNQTCGSKFQNKRTKTRKTKLVTKTLSFGCMCFVVANQANSASNLNRKQPSQFISLVLCLMDHIALFLWTSQLYPKPISIFQSSLPPCLFYSQAHNFAYSLTTQPNI